MPDAATTDTTAAPPVDDYAAAVAAAEAITSEVEPEATGEPGDDGTEPGSDSKKPEPPVSKIAASLARKRNKLKEERASLDQARRDFASQSEALQAQLRDVETTKALLSKLSDPEQALAALESLGLTYSDLTAIALKQGTPDAKVERLQRELEAERKTRTERDEAARKERERADGEAAAQQAQKLFMGIVRDGKYPEAALYEDAEIIEAAEALGTQLHAETGRWPNLETLATELEARLAALHAKQRERLGVGSAAKKPAATTAKTLTNRDAAEITGRTREETDEERRAAAIAMAEKLLR